MSPLTEADQQLLLRIARRALEEKIRLQNLPPPAEMPSSVARPGGAFVTLHIGGALRGCVGRVESSHPLYQTVYECAISAALSDSRFDPVLSEEVPRLQIEVSALSPLVDIRPEDIEVGVHGLLISQGMRHGLLLPQVATEWQWDRTKFLDQTCVKAGLAQDAWKRGARIQAFTAQVFAEGGPGG
ncbi:MAG TPA: AmmeMemoRadiSam system protein A [Terriglobia bacterium]|nr:AmmeMemoRadiSam system protein A [Terriglobia bacterium]